MNHFFAIHTSLSQLSDQKESVQQYFKEISQVENFSVDDLPFSAMCFGHTSWPRIDLPHSQRNHFTFIGSARLDNWDELLQECENQNFTQPSELILALFEKYKEKAFAKLIGDFSFVIWDAKKQLVYCAKDPIGIRPLFYLQQADISIFSSSISAIRAFIGIDKLNLNTRYISKELKNSTFQVEETFFNEIHRLKPAHYGVIGQGEPSFVENRYWSFKAIDTSAFASEKQVFDELRRLFQQAIQTRLRGVKQAATQLSGGLDSSAITVLASRIMPKENLHTFSFVLNEKTRAYSKRGIDEQATQNSIIEYAHLLRTNHHVSDFFYYQDTFACYDKSDQIMGGFANSDSIWQDSMYKQAAEFGVELIFSGFPGDEGISNPGGRYYFEYFHQKKWSWMFKQGFRHPYVFAKQCYHYFNALFGNTTMRGYDKIQKKRNLLDPNSGFHAQLIDTSFAFTSSFRQELIDKVFRAHSCLRTESESLYASQYGIVTAYPMADLRFVQFALSLPVEYFNPKKFSRSLFRTICEGILPDDVRLQKKQNGAMTLAFAEYWKKEQIEDFKKWQIKNSLQLFDTNKVFDEINLDVLGRKVVLNKMDYLIEKNLSRHAK